MGALRTTAPRYASASDPRVQLPARPAAGGRPRTPAGTPPRAKRRIARCARAFHTHTKPSRRHRHGGQCRERRSPPQPASRVPRERRSPPQPASRVPPPLMTAHYPWRRDAAEGKGGGSSGRGRVTVRYARCAQSRTANRKEPARRASRCKTEPFMRYSRVTLWVTRRAACGGKDADCAQLARSLPRASARNVAPSPPPRAYTTPRHGGNPPPIPRE
jgi:hypothetical protein